MQVDKWWDAQGVTVNEAIDEFRMPAEVVIWRVKLECVDEGSSGSWWGPPEPPVYEPKWEETIIVKPIYKWFGRGDKFAS
ncbi:hypothetical protein [Paenibacillus naphthalenovorans]|uniref:hypothetical protein n=1 Tax=Paenibacillus naphthalenovorans TaxID=162209 RepID=UPI003D29EF80